MKITNVKICDMHFPIVREVVHEDDNYILIKDKGVIIPFDKLSIYQEYQRGRDLIGNTFRKYKKLRKYKKQ